MWRTSVILGPLQHSRAAKNRRSSFSNQPALIPTIRVVSTRRKRGNHIRGISAVSSMFKFVHYLERAAIVENRRTVPPSQSACPLQSFPFPFAVRSLGFDCPPLHLPKRETIIVTYDAGRLFFASPASPSSYCPCVALAAS